MSVEWRERPRRGTEFVPSSITCDVCGARAQQPGPGGLRAQARFEQVRRPDMQTNEPTVVAIADLCHDCGDRVAEFLQGMAEKGPRPGVCPREPDRFGS